MFYVIRGLWLIFKVVAINSSKPYDLKLKISFCCDFRPMRARKAAINCIKRVLQISHVKGTPQVALVSDTPSFAKEIKSDISEFAEVCCFVEYYSMSTTLLTKCHCA
jgi:hypothetical protein